MKNIKAGNLTEQHRYVKTNRQETAVLVGISLPDEDDRLVSEHLDELQMLAETAGAKTLKRFTQNLSHAHPRHFVGPGKLQEIKQYAENNKADMVIFDGELSPRQLSVIEKEFKDCKILDRTNLILDIFASHARTAQAKMQVDLAQSEYLLPRLTGMWTHLSRQKGGIGMKGPGEKEIETDRRIVRRKIKLLKEKLEQLDKQSGNRRKGREEKIRVALVGYTNAGKSTVMNLLSDASVIAENKLFATLDTTVRKVVLEEIPFLISDTVGFIRKLPHTLVESFKSTLDEVKEADLLLHVIDISHPQYEDHIQSVQKTLSELKSANKPTLLVFNKIDAYKIIDDETQKPMGLEQKLQVLEKTYHTRGQKDVVFISAVEKININELRSKMIEKVKSLYKERYPHQPPHIYGIISDENADFSGNR